MVVPLLCLLFCVGSHFADGLFVDTEEAIILQGHDASFGYQVAQLPGNVIVGAPLYQDKINKTGQLYQCNPKTRICRPINIPVSADDVDISLGISLAVRGDPPQLIACCPTLESNCGQTKYVNGRCYLLDHRLQLVETLPHSLPDCSASRVDIVFLIDGSGSVKRSDFTRMINFVNQVMNEFRNYNVQFALMQFSSIFEIHFDFKDYSASRNPEELTESIRQQFGGTLTSSAIMTVMKSLFKDERGSCEASQKLLIVITDGETIGDNTPFSVSIGEAERQKVLRYAIGVGDAFNTQRAFNELQTIASHPSSDHVFRVGDFSLLNEIQNKLQNRIFAIEGLRGQKELPRTKLELSQERFSSILTSKGAMLGSVGEYDWQEAISVFRSREQTSSCINITQGLVDLKDAYLGYPLLQVTPDLIAAGAPTYQQTGRLVIFQRSRTDSKWHPRAIAYGDKTGSHFGSTLSGIRINTNSTGILLLVGAPTYHSANAPGGCVYLCPLDATILASSDMVTLPVTLLCTNTLHGDPTQLFGHFGSAISILPDLTGDRIPDLAVGAPYEDENIGAIYIFSGQPGGFSTSYIQRIAGNTVSTGLMYFGCSVTGNLDMTEDGIPDLTVGSEGKVLVLRSLPVLGVSVSMSFLPYEIPLTFCKCPDPSKQGTATEVMVCVDHSVRSTELRGPVSAQLNYTLTLDKEHSQSRAVFSTVAGRSVNGILQLTAYHVCVTHSIILPECVKDPLSPLQVTFKFSMIGKFVLSEDSTRHHSGQVSFQKDCGSDSVGLDDLNVDATFNGI